MIYWGVSERGKVGNMFPLDWHVQRSGSPGGRRRGSKLTNILLAAGVL